MKKTILFITVGVGGDTEEKKNSLAHSILYSIKHIRPQKVVFFVSQESNTNLFENYIKPNLKIAYEVIVLTNIHDFNELFEKMKNSIESIISKEGCIENIEGIINFTSGTKLMSAVALILGTIYKFQLVYVEGKRKDGIVMKGFEHSVTLNTNSFYDNEYFHKFIDYFNAYRWDSALEMLEHIVDTERYNVDALKNITEGFKQWDLFNHCNALDHIMRGLRSLKIINKNKFSKNIKFLSKLCNIHKEILSKKKELMKENLLDIYFDDLVNLQSDYWFYLLLDLYENAKRRYDEKKYDDALARLYRCIEMIAQIVLMKYYRIKTSSVNIHEVNDKIRSCLLTMGYDEGSQQKIPLALEKSYLLLNCLADEFGKKYVENKTLRNLLKNRNESILAHGFKPIDSKCVNTLLNKVWEFIELLCKKMKKSTEEGIQFPLLNVYE